MSTYDPPIEPPGQPPTMKDVNDEMPAKRPWADDTHHSYHGPKTHQCLGCGEAASYSSWGPWCYPCNVERMTRLNKSMAELARSIGNEDVA